ncbi:adenosylcobinamide-GDP ribazoletransferase [Sphaerochaeta halotolerans]|uniref:Adenosylcobinamide-GDP ribazoletransferase n=1 Tax=Sphaerochaeta halotolerans TaxID=2293840 RepID=A0A372MG30_9SPIR|nr:adenosylcobinamide-GDP ribazoletransferase [Sphaerochaeta halotolerans]MBG0767211.1 adenosylcobinamide-GDP ribazoletransferase [Spirochaetaceae bacterium]MDN5334203.1 adenosylcobinamide-GDP ribazoletransferase [Sphaerochaeta sp.]MXI86400.1 adenosylcobinamide-GDP ribazoletransferase [Sphaerochaeta halotolerans]RFU94747.1 adenosylcobinamide-GDP ribazoletransferase [Sphaerochaeta halotolerans]
MITLGLGGALRTLTRFPLPYRTLEKEQRILFWFPFVGALFGLFFVGASYLPFSAQIRSALILALSAYLSRGFHLDGLCDFADGLGGGWNKERSLAIMKDSNSGAFALITLFCVLLIQYASLQQLVDIPLALLLVPMLGRLNQVIAASLMPYAREGEGTASLLVRSAKPYHIVLPLLQVVIILVLLFLYSHEYAFNALIAFLLSLCTGMLVLLISRKRLGGVTGDVLGAVEVLTETAAMLGFLLPLATQAISR